MFNYKKRCRELEEENRKLTVELRAVQDKMATMDLGKKFAEPDATSRSPFIEGRGAKWMKRADGKLDRVVYCPRCELVMTPVPADHPVNHRCSVCGHETDFGLDDLESVVADIT